VNVPLDTYRDYLLTLARIELGAQPRGVPEASDIVQQTLLQAHRNREQFRGHSQAELAAWLRQILSHQLVDAIRSAGREKRDERRNRSLDQALNESSVRLGDWLAADQSSPSQSAHREERALRISAALAQLPAAQCEALILQHWHGWSLAQIGAHMDRSPVAVAGLLKRGLRQLRTVLVDPD
jgi:RNA polymerase sigma-70 factor (ECF subfamily)